MNMMQFALGESKNIKKVLIEKNRQLRRIGRFNIITALDIVPIDLPQCADLAVAAGALAMLQRLLSDPDERAEMARLGKKSLEIYGASGCVDSAVAAVSEPRASDEVVPAAASGGLEGVPAAGATLAELGGETGGETEIGARAEVSKAAAEVVSTPVSIDEFPVEGHVPLVEEGESTEGEQIPDFLMNHAQSGVEKLRNDDIRPRASPVDFARRRT